ncbi:MAG: RadC family protein [Christensenellaceae bacterium]
MHEKHRQRLREKLVSNGDLLADHELLELLLFYAIPRVNTNDIAHDLINTFGSLEKVLKANAKELASVRGVGEKTAVFLNTVGIIFQRIKPKTEEISEFFSYADIKEPIIKMFKGLKDEVFVALLLDNKNKIIAKYVICDHSPYKVDINISEFSKQIITHKPSYVVLAHNHLSGICTPTPADDKATEKLGFVLRFYNVDLVDHLIVADNKVYSYYYENRMDKIKTQFEKYFKELT